MLLRFDMQVFGSDGTAAGQVDRILADPARREITHVAVRSPRVSEEVLLPLSLIQGNVEDRLLLHIPSGDLEQMPRYYDGRTSSPPAGRVDARFVRGPADRRFSLEEALNVPANAVELGPKTRVVLTDGTSGNLSGIATEQYANRLSEVIARGLSARNVSVPGEWVGDLGSDAIAVNTTREQIERLVGAPAAQYISDRQDGGGP